MKARRKGKPYDPGKQGHREGYLHANPPAQPAVHDRRSTDLTIGAKDHVAVMDVIDPLGLEPGDKIEVLRHLRNDPLGKLHSQGAIDEAQYQAGRSFQSDWERAERGPRAIDPFKEYVDGGLASDPISDNQIAAVERLTRAQKKLGEEGARLAHDVLVHGFSMDQVCKNRSLEGEVPRKYYGKRFREVLETLAVVYGHSNRAKKIQDIDLVT